VHFSVGLCESIWSWVVYESAVWAQLFKNFFNFFTGVRFGWLQWQKNFQKFLLMALHAIARHMRAKCRHCMHDMHFCAYHTYHTYQLSSVFGLSQRCAIWKHAAIEDMRKLKTCCNRRHAQIEDMIPSVSRMLQSRHADMHDICVQSADMHDICAKCRHARHITKLWYVAITGVNNILPLFLIMSQNFFAKIARYVTNWWNVAITGG
jgi:hypothetical protein